MRADELIARISEAVPQLSSRVEGAAELAALMGSNEMPQATPAAYVVPLGFDAGPQRDATGIHEQMVTESFGVVIVIDYAGDATGAAALPEIEDMVEAVRAALKGWQPVSAIDALSLRRGRLVDLRNGTVFYQLDVSLTQNDRTSAS